MRLLASVGLYVLVASAALRAEDKPEARAKEAAEAFLKAVKEKDAAAALKASDVPFLMPDLKEKRPQLSKIEKVEALTENLKAIIEMKENLPSGVGEVKELAVLKKKIAGTPEADAPEVKLILEVGGDAGYLVSLVDEKKDEAGMLLVRVKKDASKVVGVLPIAKAAPAKNP